MGRTAPTIIEGTQYGHLTTTGVYIPSCTNGVKWIPAKVECICDCGNISLKKLDHLTSGKTKSCSKKCPYFGHITHGLSREGNRKVTKEYMAWHNMITKCNNPKHISYPWIGGIGITYHDSLSTMEGFWEIMGKAPSKYHIFMRIDKDGDYEPGNVHWYLASKKKI
jgi:hypothetical protein